MLTHHECSCRFLVRLLLVHGTLADYRLGRLIKYSFYKNITFAFMFLFFQPFNGVSGQVRHFQPPYAIHTCHRVLFADTLSTCNCSLLLALCRTVSTIMV